jgi:hypothetical protein
LPFFDFSKQQEDVGSADENVDIESADEHRDEEFV